MATVLVHAYDDVNTALAALRKAEAEQFLRDCGCPEEEIAVNVAAIMDAGKNNGPDRCRVTQR